MPSHVKKHSGLLFVSLNYRCGGSVGFFSPTSRLSLSLFKKKAPNEARRVEFIKNIVNQRCKQPWRSRAQTNRNIHVVNIFSPLPIDSYNSGYISLL